MHVFIFVSAVQCTFIFTGLASGAREKWMRIQTGVAIGAVGSWWILFLWALNTTGFFATFLHVSFPIFDSALRVIVLA